jgi:hypothetical protein
MPCNEADAVRWARLNGEKMAIKFEKSEQEQYSDVFS